MQDYSTLPLFSLQPETKEIPLTQGKVAIVDAADYEWLSKHAWRLNRGDGGNFYAVRTARNRNNKNQLVRMHREIINAKPHELVDHVNGNGLDNRRVNLRIATRTQNAMNKSSLANTSSQYKGVSWKKEMGRWVAQITSKKRRLHIGYFADEVAAAHAYDRIARQLYGEFARLNFKEDSYVWPFK